MGRMLFLTMWAKDSFNSWLCTSALSLASRRWSSQMASWTATKSIYKLLSRLWMTGPRSGSLTFKSSKEHRTVQKVGSSSLTKAGMATNLMVLAGRASHQALTKSFTKLTLILGKIPRMISLLSWIRKFAVSFSIMFQRPRNGHGHDGQIDATKSWTNPETGRQITYCTYQKIRIQRP